MVYVYMDGTVSYGQMMNDMFEQLLIFTLIVIVY